MTVYPMIDSPPVNSGAVHDTTDEPVGFAEETFVAVTPTGALGALIASVTVEDPVERLVPTSLIATTATWPETFPGIPVMTQASVSVTQENPTGGRPGRDTTKVA